MRSLNAMWAALWAAQNYNPISALGKPRLVWGKQSVWLSAMPQISPFAAKVGQKPGGMAAPTFTIGGMHHE